MSGWLYFQTACFSAAFLVTMFFIMATVRERNDLGAFVLCIFGGLGTPFVIFSIVQFVKELP